MDWTSALERLRADKGGWERVARATGLSGNQIRRIASGETPSPRIDTVEKIVGYYASQELASMQAQRASMA